MLLDQPLTCRRIGTLRRQRGLSQKQLGGQLGVVIETISRWENGHTVPRGRMLRRIAAALDVPIHDLFDA